MKVKQTFIGTDLVLHCAGEVLPDDAYSPEVLQDLYSSGLIELDKEPEKAKPKTTKSERRR